jgi:pimeloyl-ACP methyl ester carboxylesterase
MAQRIYCLPGLGADFRIFQHVKVPDAELHPLPWLLPEHNESLPAFAKRMAAQIQDREPILLGVSFGGMLATEMSRVLKSRATIIVSSCRHSRELPPYFRAAGRLHLHRILPYRLVAHSRSFSRLLLDTRSTSEERWVKQIMLQHSQPALLQRAVHMILHWRYAPPPPGITHIHGRLDKLLPARYTHPDILIEDAGHFMIWNKADQISRHIHRLLQ